MHFILHGRALPPASTYFYQQALASVLPQPSLTSKLSTIGTRIPHLKDKWLAPQHTVTCLVSHRRTKITCKQKCIFVLFQIWHHGSDAVDQWAMVSLRKKFEKKLFRLLAGIYDAQWSGQKVQMKTWRARRETPVRWNGNTYCFLILIAFCRVPIEK
jgi:hypothetical protein